VGHRGRVLPTAATLLLLVFAVIARAAPQKSAPASIPPRSPASANHGLVLILSGDETPEAPDSFALKTCLANHPRLACVPLSLTIKNAGDETILRFFGSCNDMSIGFDLLMPDGHWGPFPSFTGFVLPLCTRSISMVEGFWPGESYVLHLRLADPDLWLDTEFPAPDPDDGLIHMHQEKGFAILERSGLHTIRAHRHINGCVAFHELKPGNDLHALAWRSLCVGGKEPKLSFVLQSNGLTLESGPSH
jgi:hypothetical protein